MHCRLLTIIAAFALCALWATPANAAYPGGNGKIAFSSTRVDPDPVNCFFPQCNFEIYSMSPDGSGVTRLTNDPGPDLNPAWSPDGTQIAFDRGPSGGIWVMNADGSGVRQLAARGDSPTWSPDGSQIAFAFPGAIYTVPAAGGTPHLIQNGACTGPLDENLEPTDPCHTYFAPVWSPGGDLIATTRRDEQTPEGPITFSVAVVRADGSGQVSQVPISSANPDWAPSGSQLAFNSIAVTPGNLADLWRSNPDGSGLTPVTDTTTYENFPAWSPDGTRIVFARRPGGDAGALEIWTASPSGGAEAQLTSSPGDDTMPDWQPLPGPRRADYRNAAHFCKAERAFLGDDAFRAKYGGGANAHGRCVSQGG